MLSTAWLFPNALIWASIMLLFSYACKCAIVLHIMLFSVMYITGKLAAMVVVLHHTNIDLYIHTLR